MSTPEPDDTRARHGAAPSSPPTTPGTTPGTTPPTRRSDRSPWNWLLLLPLVVTLWPPLYNRRTPELFSIPFFYWYQLVTVFVGVACTLLVYRRTKG